MDRLSDPQHRLRRLKGGFFVRRAESSGIGRFGAGIRLCWHRTAEKSGERGSGETSTLPAAPLRTERGTGDRRGAAKGGASYAAMTAERKSPPGTFRSPCESFICAPPGGSCAALSGRVRMERRCRGTGAKMRDFAVGTPAGGGYGSANVAGTVSCSSGRDRERGSPSGV